jgi:hypothetical protein
MKSKFSIQTTLIANHKVVAALGIAVSLWIALPSAIAQTTTHPPKRLKRSEAFLGMHFDFHASDDCKEIGKNTTRGMIEGILDQVKPDYLQIDCKGHRGLSSYPTKVGNPAPGFVGDPLRLWRQVTAERGVSLYMHYSGVWDSEAIKRHPDWAVINADGKRDTNATSPFGPYVDELLIPQFRELAGDYGVDGAWVDGECWAAKPDFSETAQAAFRKETGLQEIPHKKGDANWKEWMDFQREAFRKYLRHYVRELKKSHPDFELCSNWAFSDLMEEPVTADLAFLSGDFSPQNSVNSARVSARCLAEQGKPWDLMAWSFSAPQSSPVRPLKTVKQLEQEAAVVLAQGGGFQAYFRQKRDGSIYDWQMKLMAEVARFCRERQALCHRQEAVPQIALLYSRSAHTRAISHLFGSWGSEGIEGMRGVLQNLCDSQQSVEIVSEHHLAGRMARWPLIVVPEWDYLEPAFREELLAYVKGGGNLLLIGPKAAGLFTPELGVEFEGGPQSDAPRYLQHNGWLAGHTTLFQKVKLGAAAKPFGTLHATDDPGSPSEPAASITQLGAGKIAAIYVNLGNRYLNARTPVARDFLCDLVRELFPQPMIEVRGSHSVDVSLCRNHGKLLVNLVNTAGPHEQEKQYTFDDIPSVGPLQVKVRLPKKPKAMRLEPAGQPLKFTWRDSVATVTVPKVDMHEVVLVSE